MTIVETADSGRHFGNKRKNLVASIIFFKLFPTTKYYKTASFPESVESASCENGLDTMYALYHTKIFWTELNRRHFADDKLYVAQMMTYFCNRIENFPGKGESLGHQIFFFTMLQKGSWEPLKLGILW